MPDVWYYSVDGKTMGPFTEEQLINVFRSPRSPGVNALVFSKDLTGGWVKATDIDGLLPPEAVSLHPPAVLKNQENVPNSSPGGAETKRCTECGEVILAVAKRCKHCQADLSLHASSVPGAVSPLDQANGGLNSSAHHGRADNRLNRSCYWILVDKKIITIKDMSTKDTLFVVDVKRPLGFLVVLIGFIPVVGDKLKFLADLVFPKKILIYESNNAKVINNLLLYILADYVKDARDSTIGRIKPGFTGGFELFDLESQKKSLVKADKVSMMSPELQFSDTSGAVCGDFKLDKNNKPGFFAKMFGATPPFLVNIQPEVPEETRCLILALATLAYIKNNQL